MTKAILAIISTSLELISLLSGGDEVSFGDSLHGE